MIGRIAGVIVTLGMVLALLPTLIKAIYYHMTGTGWCREGECWITCKRQTQGGAK